jgi:excisionase family DNA binding protein
MSAYASHQRESLAGGRCEPGARLQLFPSAGRPALWKGSPSTPSLEVGDGSATVFEQLTDQLVDRLAAAVAERLARKNSTENEWLDSRHAADYLGVHRDTLRKLAAERAIPSEQDGPGCKLYFRRSDLDAWRRGGGRPRHLATVIASAA